MATTDTPPAATDEATELWTTSYEGEVFGEAYFERMADLATDEGEQSKLRALATLERCTKELLQPSMRRHGLPTAPGEDVLAGVAQLDEYDYPTVLASVLPFAGQYLGHYARLRELVDSEDAATVDQLIAHEMALEVFARRELGGGGEDPLQPLRALSHVTL